MDSKLYKYGAQTITVYDVTVENIPEVVAMLLDNNCSKFSVEVNRDNLLLEEWQDTFSLFIVFSFGDSVYTLSNKDYLCVEVFNGQNVIYTQNKSEFEAQHTLVV